VEENFLEHFSVSSDCPCGYLSGKGERAGEAVYFSSPLRYSEIRTDRGDIYRTQARHFFLSRDEQYTYCRLKKAVQEINKKGHEFNCQIVLKKLLTFLSVCWMTSSYVALFAPESSTEFMLIYINWWNNCLFRLFKKSIRYFQHFMK